MLIHYKPSRVLLLLLTVLALVCFKLNARGGFAQSKSERTPAGESGQSAASGNDVVRLSATAKPTGGTFKGRSRNPAAMDAAVTSNAQLQTTLEWTFGGKVQRGWGLYTPLIGELI